MAKGSVTLKVQDSGQLRVLSGLRMQITGGVHAEDGTAVHDRGPLSVVQVAAVNEFGGGKIPARLWLRGWVSLFEKVFVERIKRDMLGMVKSQKFDVRPFSDISFDIMQSIRGRILRGEIKPANAPMTLARKSPENRPLFEFGQLVEAIKGRVRANNGWHADRG